MDPDMTWRNQKIKRMCNIPFGAIERMKSPEKFRKNKDPRDIGPITDTPADAKLWCLEGTRTPIPHINGEIYWIPWDPIAGRTPHEGKYVIKTYQANCSITELEELDCQPVQTRRQLIRAKKYANFFNRICYHLFFSTYKDNKLTEVKQVLHKNWLVSELMRRALGKRAKKITKHHKAPLAIGAPPAVGAAPVPALPAAQMKGPIDKSKIQVETKESQPDFEALPEDQKKIYNTDEESDWLALARAEHPPPQGKV